jgi:hypothetical protein
LKGYSVTFFVVIALALAVWVFFYVTTIPLNATETSVVVGVCAVMVVAAKWIWTRARKLKKHQQASEGEK